jgi:hypothetical protein
MMGPAALRTALLSLAAVLVLGIIVVAPAKGVPSPLRTAARGASRAPSCPLSLAEQEKAIKAFEKMLPVIQHPRCQNCHGAVNPFIDRAAGGHLGEKQTEGNIADCQECHGELPGWEVAPEPMQWAKKSGEQICLQMRQFFSKGAEFVGHMRNENGKPPFFTDAAFKGMRALNEMGRDVSETERGAPPKPEPPPGTLAALVGHAQAWVDAMGGEFVGSNECGCVHSKIELKMTSEWTGTGSGSTVIARVSVTVPLKPDSSGLVFTGKAPLKHGVYSITTPPGCRADLKPSGGELAVTEARFDVGADQRMTISLAMAPTMSGGTMAFICPQVRMPVMPILPWSGEWQYLHQGDLIGREYHFDEFEAASGLSLAGERKLVGRKEVTRTKTKQGMTVTSKTIFEFWWLGLETSAK